MNHYRDGQASSRLLLANRQTRNWRCDVVAMLLRIWLERLPDIDDDSFRFVVPTHDSSATYSLRRSHFETEGPAWLTSKSINNDRDHLTGFQSDGDYRAPIAAGDVIATSDLLTA